MVISYSIETCFVIYSRNFQLLLSNQSAWVQIHTIDIQNYKKLKFRKPSCFEASWSSAAKNTSTPECLTGEENHPAHLGRAGEGVPHEVGGKTQAVYKHHTICYPSQAILQRIYLL